ncbi:helix-hairpin-helix domain-containing protein [Vagococcus xieshaowenii]|uniref:helix-hairpin-helix domain-containing protein n=1 Tax=Vagococcus xieshaowenii TaxID=2562451 RepID=UPI00143231C3|nr:helix-hairpin-helix domain-containing protein [Vagococcus xieshaowenii]
MDKWQMIDKRWLVGGGILIVTTILFVWFRNQTAASNDVFLESSAIERIDSTSETTSGAVNQQEMRSESLVAYVDIKGAVTSPGIYQITPNMRVSEVISLAGGFTENADSHQVNLAQRVTDQMVVYVPEQGEETPALVQAESLNELTTNQVGDEPSNQAKVNINTATLEDLQRLNGVGLVKAQAMLDYRETNGAFQSIEELKNVKGVGEKTFDSLKESITID